MIKTTNYIVVFIVLLFTQSLGFAQYTGGSADGAHTDQVSYTTCGTPSQFFAYMGGSGDGASTNQYTLTTCGTPAQFVAYMGGSGDGFSANQYTLTTCGTPAQYVAYMGGSGDGFSTNTFTLTSCGTPPQFVAYMGGSGDGFSRDTINKCPTAPPVANFTASATSVCAGTTVNFTDLSTNSPAAWAWTFQGGTPTTFTVQNPTVVYNTPGTYSVSLVATNSMGTNTYTVANYITVNAIPTANAGSDVAICTGSSTTLTATGGGTYSWTPSTGLSATNIANPVANPTNTTTYSVTVTTGGCSATDAMTVTVNPIPTANAGPSKVICKGASVTLNASGGGTYSWTPSTGLTSTTSASPGASPTVTTNYSVTVTVAGCSATDSLIVTVNPLPTVAITPSGPTTFCAGDSVILTSSAATTYTWSTSANTQSIKVFTAGSYFVSVKNVFGCQAISASTNVVVHPQGTASITPGGPTTFCQGGSVNLTANSGAAYSWTGGATTQSINVTTSGTYTVSVDDVFGCTVPSPTASIVITVNPNPATPTITPSSATALCTGDTVTLTSSVENSYSWNTGATTQSILASNGGTYSVTVSNIFNCSATSAPISVTVDTPLADFVSDTQLVFIPSAVVNFTATVVGHAPYVYAWSFGDGGTSSSPSPGHTYNTVAYDTVSLTVTDSMGCSNTITKPSYIEVERLFPSTPMLTGTTLDLTAVSFINAVTGIISLTDGNCILSVDSGNTWSALPTGQTRPLRHAYIMLNEWFAAGDSGTIIHSTNNGLAWTPFSTGTFETFSSTSFMSPTSGFAVGTNGEAQIYNGASWSPIPTGVGVHLNSVDALPNGDAVAVGDAQTILYYNGTWTPQTSPLNFDIRGTRFYSTLGGYAVGTGGNILRTTNGGATWTPCLTGVDIDFNAVDIQGTNNAWATGSHGIVYVTGDGGNTWIRYSVGDTIPQNSIKVTGGKGHVVGAGGNGRNFLDTSHTTISPSMISAADFDVFPNPALDNFTINVQMPYSTQLTIEMKDVNGRMVKTIANGVASGHYSTKVNTDNIRAGIYFIHVTQGQKSWVRKLLLVK